MVLIMSLLFGTKGVEDPVCRLVVRADTNVVNSNPHGLIMPLQEGGNLAPFTHLDGSTVVGQPEPAVLQLGHDAWGVLLSVSLLADLRTLNNRPFIAPCTEYCKGGGCKKPKSYQTILKLFICGSET